jgi:hypothetical protein
LLKKLITFIPDEHYQAVSSAVFAAGAGHIGNYSETSFNTPGFGTFRGNEQSNPKIGKAGELEKVSEIRFETIFPAYLEGKVLSALFTAHPYEEVAYDVVLVAKSMEPGRFGDDWRGDQTIGNGFPSIVKG